MKRIAAELNDAQSELKRLQAIINRLPKTVDGVPITVSMVVWIIRYDTNGEPYIKSYWVDQLRCTGDEPQSMDLYYYEYNMWESYSDVCDYIFSSHTAAKEELMAMVQP